ncbi:DUF4180 domain-containing protein [candidate division KSB1 bacterium]|nr:DUF4180 domain-containing protein [candidate division KSB1 bacterium]
MEIIIHEHENIRIAEIQSDNIVLNNVQDALDIMVTADEKGARKIIMYEKNIHPDFFLLRTRLAGEILQKFTNYMVNLAIVGDFNKYNSKSLSGFIYETNKGNQFCFVDSLQKAKDMLLK